MRYFLSFLVAAAFAFIYWVWINKKPRQSKPAKQKPTMFDVRSLLREGKKEEAVRLYVKIFKVSLKQARKDVEELERSLNV